MIEPSVVEEVRRLLAEGKLSQRKIAKHLGISRATVGAIASGKRPDYQPRPREEDDPFQITGPPRRCPGCGGVVYLPCRLCYVREMKRKEKQQARRRAIMSAGRIEELHRLPRRPFTSTPERSPAFSPRAEPRRPHGTTPR